MNSAGDRRVEAQTWNTEIEETTQISKEGWTQKVRKD